MAVHQAKGYAVKEGILYERLVERVLRKHKLSYFCEPKFKELLFRPDFWITSTKRPCILFTTHARIPHAAKNKFWESLNELFEVKIGIGPDVRVGCLLFGRRDGWFNYCLQGFHDFYDFCIEAWIDSIHVKRYLNGEKISDQFLTYFRGLEKEILENLKSNQLSNLTQKIVRMERERLKSWPSLDITVPKFTPYHALCLDYLVFFSDEEFQHLLNFVKGKCKTLDNKYVAHLVNLEFIKESASGGYIPTKKGKRLTKFDFFLERHDILKIVEFIVKEFYPKLRPIVRDLQNPGIIKKKLERFLELTSNFQCGPNKLGEYIHLCSKNPNFDSVIKSETNWLLESAIAFTPLKLMNISREAETLVRMELGKGLFSIKEGFMGTIMTELDLTQSTYLARVILKYVNRKMKLEDAFQRFLGLRQYDLKTNSKLTPLKAVFALKLIENDIPYEGYPEKAYVALDTIVSDKQSTRGLTGRIAVSFIIKKKGGGNIYIATKSTLGDQYHRTSELSGRFRGARYCVSRKDQCDVRNRNDEYWVLLDGKWTKKWVNRLESSGIRAFFAEEPNKEWKIIAQIKSKI